MAIVSLSRAPSILMAERNGTRAPSPRAKRRSKRTGLSATVSSRQDGAAMLAFAASVRATASHSTAFISSLGLGNLAIVRCPSWSRTDALGRAPPRDEP